MMPVNTLNKQIHQDYYTGLPAPSIELAIFAVESNIPPPAVRLAAISSSSASVCPFVSLSGRELSKLRLESADSSRPTRSGIRWSRPRPERWLVSSSCSSARVVSSKSSESRSYSALVF